jgi:8-oxo-dGTP pyrophosphatase MutT (NUDIX family)
MNDSPDVVYQQAAAIPFLVDDHTPRILLITSRRRKRWIVPKGIIEEWQSSRETAVEEAYEEAGVHGTLVDGTVGEYEYDKWGGRCHVEVFLLRVEEELTDWPEADFRDRKWVGVEEALDMVDNDGLCSVLQRAAELMK